MQRSTLLVLSGALMIVCSIVTIFFGVLFYGYYQSQLHYYYGGQGYLEYFYSWMVSICAFAFALPAGILLLMKKFTRVSIALTFIVLLFGLSLPIILAFMGIVGILYTDWITGVISGLLGSWYIIVLSALALVLAFLGHRNRNQVTPKSIDTQVNVS